MRSYYEERVKIIYYLIDKQKTFFSIKLLFKSKSSKINN